MSRLSPKRKTFILSWLIYVIVFTVGGIIYFNVERGLLGETTLYPSTHNPYDPVASGFSIIIGSIFLGMILGLSELTLFRYKFNNLRFFYKILLKAAVYAVILVFFLIILAFPINSSALDLGWTDPAVIQTVKDFVADFAFWSAMIHCALFITLALFIKEMIDNIGIGQVVNFFTGKYHTSKVEERVFMFLDMKGSTTIAEQMGHQKYYRFLNRYYRDMTRAIVDSKGEVYQYIGDEIVLSWEDEEGLDNNNCIQCFFSIKEAIEKKIDYYHGTFGVVPTFKAGIHIGQVTRGEVGVLKKELLFTGDALNVTARIQSLCNELEAELLVSADLLNQLDLKPGLETISKGSFELRGRYQRIELFSVQRS
ncbi:MAG: adenylate cyclase [Roseivirga sp.]|jgi:adenylate cyclase